jgi:hypothetical protein
VKLRVDVNAVEPQGLSPCHCSFSFRVATES